VAGIAYYVCKMPKDSCHIQTVILLNNLARDGPFHDIFSVCYLIFVGWCVNSMHALTAAAGGGTPPCSCCSLAPSTNS
jgi:hypothetical protein